MFKRLYLLIIPLIALIITGCGLSEESIKSGKAAVKTVSKMESKTKKAESVFLESKEYKEMIFYVKKEKLMDNFISSMDLVKKAKTKAIKIEELIKLDEDKHEQQLKMLITDINSFNRRVSGINERPLKRLKTLIESKKESKKIYENSLNIQSRVKSVVKKHLDLLELKKKDFPKKTIDINNRIAEINKLTKIIDDNVKIAKVELDKDKTMDISNFVNSTDFIIVTEKNITQKRVINEKRMSELDKSYTKILSDMKSKHYLIVKRVSWDNYYDYPTENTYTYQPILIPNDMINLYYNVGDIGTYKKGFLGSFNLKISNKLWNALRINKIENMPSGDDEAEFWLEDIKSVYYHKYIIIENDKKRTTDFVKVDENQYYNNVDNLGMALVSKAYGDYESETVKTAAPAGLAFVDNPKYGEWKQNSSGNSFFYYYGMYSMFNDLSGGNRYSRDYYNDYNRNYKNKKPYYSGGYGTYGKRTYSKGNSFSKSSYAKRNRNAIKSGSLFKKKPAKRTVSKSGRSIGTSSRGRGPGGGGK